MPRHLPGVCRIHNKTMKTTHTVIVKDASFLERNGENPTQLYTVPAGTAYYLSSGRMVFANDFSGVMPGEFSDEQMAAAKPLEYELPDV